jgi:hypothetical protein
MNMTNFLGSAANSTSPEGGDDDLGDVDGDFVCGKRVEAVSMLAQHNRKVVSVSQWKHMIRPTSEVPAIFKGIVALLATIPSPSANALAAAANASGKVLPFSSTLSDGRVAATRLLLLHTR